MVGQQVAAVGQDDRDRQLDQVVVDESRSTGTRRYPVDQSDDHADDEIAANDTVASTGVTGSSTALIAIANRTSPVPSFSRLSPSTMVASVVAAPAGA